MIQHFSLLPNLINEDTYGYDNEVSFFLLYFSSDVIGRSRKNVYCMHRKLGSKLFNRLGFVAIFHGQYFMYTIADLYDKLSE